MKGIKIPDDSEYWEDLVDWDEEFSIITSINEVELELSIPGFFEEVKKNIVPGTSHIIQIDNYSQRSIEEVVTGVSGLYFSTRGTDFQLSTRHNDMLEAMLLDGSKLGELLNGFWYMSMERNEGRIRKDLCTVWVLLNGRVYRREGDFPILDAEEYSSDVLPL